MTPLKFYNYMLNNEETKYHYTLMALFSPFPFISKIVWMAIFIIYLHFYVNNKKDEE